MSNISKRASSKIAPRARSSAKPTSSKPNIKGNISKTSLPDKPPKPKKGLEWTLPAYSICPKSKKGIDWEELQKKLIRRQAPKGEDVKQIKRTLNELKDKKISVHEFVTLISPYTSDNGGELRSVLTEDITAFQRMARKVYDTMTQDVSDVLMNDQVASQHFYQEKHDLMTEKMMRSIGQIYAMVPNFDFEKFYKSKDEYLKIVIPLPEAVERDPDEEAMHKRQQLYHRLQWLRNEGERMFEENRRLQARLNHLKKDQEMEQVAAQETQAALEAQRTQLEKEESKMRDQLHQLNEDVERSIIESEDKEMKAMNATALESKPTKGKKGKGKPKPKRPAWVTVTAQEIEEEAAKEAAATEMASVAPAPQIKKLQQENLDLSYQPSTSLQQPSQITDDTTVERANVTTQKRREVPKGRRYMAPQDSWGGYY